MRAWQGLAGRATPGRLIVAAGLACCALAALWWLWPGDDRVAVPVAGAENIIARGRIEPFSRVLAVHGVADGAVIRKLLVDQGDRVSAGQILAVLELHDTRQAEMDLAERNLRLAELAREQVRAGAKQSEVAAQRNVMSAKEAQLVRLRAEWKRRQDLYAHEFASRQSLDALQADLSQTENEVAQAGHTLKALTETRGIDDAVAAAKVEVERANLDRARAELERTLIRAPQAGEILSIQARAGEAIGTDGLLRMAAMDQIDVVAEVDEALVPKVKLGMTAVIEAPLLDHSVSGHVTRISAEVFRQKRPSSDVLIGRDARIVEVEVTPDQPLPQVLGAEVLVRLSPASGGTVATR